MKVGGYRKKWKSAAKRRWNSLRKEVFERDNYICQKCGKKTDTPIADHIIPVYLGGWTWNKDNIQTLCKECDKEKLKNDNVGVDKQLSKKEQLERERQKQRMKIAVKLLKKR